MIVVSIVTYQAVGDRCDRWNWPEDMYDEQPYKTTKFTLIFPIYYL